MVDKRWYYIGPTKFYVPIKFSKAIHAVRHVICIKVQLLSISIKICIIAINTTGNFEAST